MEVVKIVEKKKNGKAKKVNRGNNNSRPSLSRQVLRVNNALAEEKKTRSFVKEAIRSSGIPMHTKRDTQLLAALTMPKDYIVPRLGLSLGSDPTAIASPWTRCEMAFPAGLMPPEMSASALQLYAFRDVLRNHLFPMPIITGATYSATPTLVWANGELTYPKFGSPGGLTYVSGDQLYGATLFPGRFGPSDPIRGFLLTAGQTMTFDVSAAEPSLPAATTAHFVVVVADAEGWEKVVEFGYVKGTSSATFTFTAPYTGYYAFTVRTTGLPGLPSSVTLPLPISIVVKAAPASTCWAQRAIPGFSDVASFVDAIRLTGLSLMYTNTSAPLNRQGQIVGCQLPKGSYFLNHTNFGKVASYKKSVTRDIVDGAYGFLKPTSVDDFKMRIFELPFTQVDGSVGEENVFNIYPDSDYLCLIANVTNPAGQNGYCTVGTGLEYSTLNQWIEVKPGVINEEEVDRVMQALAKVPQWHTNDYIGMTFGDGLRTLPVISGKGSKKWLR